MAFAAVMSEPSEVIIRALFNVKSYLCLTQGYTNNVY